MKVSDTFPKLTIEGFSINHANRLLNVLPKIFRIMGITDPIYIKKAECFNARIVKNWFSRGRRLQWDIPIEIFEPLKNGEQISDSGIAIVIINFVLKFMNKREDIGKTMKAWERGQPNAYQI